MATSTPAPEGRKPDLSDGTDPTSEAELRLVILPDGEMRMTSRIRFGGPATLAVGGTIGTLALAPHAGLPPKGTVTIAGGEILLAGAIVGIQVWRRRRRTNRRTR